MRVCAERLETARDSSGECAPELVGVQGPDQRVLERGGHRRGKLIQPTAVQCRETGNALADPPNGSSGIVGLCRPVQGQVVAEIFPAVSGMRTMPAVNLPALLLAAICTASVCGWTHIIGRALETFAHS